MARVAGNTSSVELARVVRVVAVVACLTGASQGIGGLLLGLEPTDAPRPQPNPGKGTNALSTTH